ncbi:MAG: potassium channel family protein [Saprospiraceae bacterium]|nr:potassium channel family protein [Saprospiraceae bacterium]
MSVLFNLFKNLQNRIKGFDRINPMGKSKKNTQRGKFRNKLNHASRVHNSRPFRWLLVMLGWFFALLVIYSVGYHILTGKSWTDGHDWLASFWQAWQTFTTVGYGDAPPDDAATRIYTIVVSTIGIAVMGAVFSAAFDYSNFLTSLKQSGYMPNPYKNGYVIFNPDVNLLASFIKELRNVEPNIPICIVDNRIEELPKHISTLPKIHFVYGNTISRDTYENANIRNNKQVIIFPRDPAVADSDGTTKTIVDLLEHFVSEETRILHILVDPENEWMFKKNRSISVLESFELWAIIQECQDPYSAQIIEKLLMNSNGITPKTVQPQKILGWTWERFVIACMKAAKATNQSCTAFAMVKKGETIVCPANDEAIDKDTLISIIAGNEFDWEHFELAMINT